MNVFLSLIVNSVMAGLMLATIIYCLKLNKRIKILQDSRSELARIIREFDESTTRATESIAEIHEATRRISENIQHKIDKANYLADDLQYMIEKGNKITGKTDNSPLRPSQARSGAEVIMAAGNKAGVVTPAAPMADGGDANGAGTRRGLGSRMRSRAEQELMNVLGKKTGEGNR